MTHSLGISIQTRMLCDLVLESSRTLERTRVVNWITVRVIGRNRTRGDTEGVSLVPGTCFDSI